MKKFLGLCVLAGLCFTTVLPVSAKTSAQDKSPNTYTVESSPRFKNLAVADFYFDIKDDGESIVETTADMYTKVDTVTLKAQMFVMKNGSWLIEKTWNDSASNVDYYSFSKSYYVDTDYNYKVMFTYNITKGSEKDQLTKTRYF